MESNDENFFKEIFKFALVAALIVIPIRVFIAQPFIVSGASMEPTFDSGQYLIIDQLSYSLENPERGEIIIFRYPKDPSKFFIKRIIGLPNETVELRGDDVIIENEAHPEGMVLAEPYIERKSRNDFLRITLDGDEYFVMGDNRPASSDSRIWGPLNEEYIVGRALIRLLPITKTGVFPGDYSN